MSGIIVAQVLANIQAVSPNVATDVEDDSFTAKMVTLNVNIPRNQAGISGFITVEPFQLPEPTDQLAAPATPTLSTSSGGTLGATTYYAKTSYLMEDGQESALSAEATQAADADTVLGVASPSAETGAVAYKIYVSNTAGGGSGAETAQAIVEIGTAWTEPTTGLIAGAALPNQETGLVTGPATITITQGAATFSVTTTQ